MRVNVQLIKAANDSHLWADTFDRKLTDIFLVESEVAKAIADQLRVRLSGQEEQAIAAKPTDNPEAYDAYLRGLAYNLKASDHARQHRWRTKISPGSSALGSEVRARLGAAVERRLGRILSLELFSQRPPFVKRRGRPPKPLSLFSRTWARPSWPKAIITTRV